MLISTQSTFYVNSLTHWLGEVPFDDKHTRARHHCSCYHWRGLPQLPSPIPHGLQERHQVVPIRPNRVVHLGLSERWTGKPPQGRAAIYCFIKSSECSLGLPRERGQKGTIDNATQETQGDPGKNFGRKIRIFLLLAGKAVRYLVPQLTLTDFGISVQEQSQERPLVLISGFIHDVSDFIEEHPGGPHLLIKMIGKDATTAFFGGVYDHSNAAHNVCCTLSLVNPWSHWLEGRVRCLSLRTKNCGTIMYVFQPAMVFH